MSRSTRFGSIKPGNTDQPLDCNWPWVSSMAAGFLFLTPFAPSVAQGRFIALGKGLGIGHRAVYESWAKARANLSQSVKPAGLVYSLGNIVFRREGYKFLQSDLGHQAVANP